VDRGDRRPLSADVAVTMSGGPLPAETDVAVIGGGITGLTAALELARSGVRPPCLDWGHNAGSTANAGSLHVQMQSRLIRLFPHMAARVERELPLYVRAVAHWRRFAEELGGDWAPLGDLTSAMSRADVVISSTAAADHVVTVDMVRQALADSETGSLMMLDLAMPRMDGWETLKWIRGNVGTAALPVLVRTGTGSDEIEAELLEAGADDYVSKSTDAKRFLARVGAVIRRTKV
jgi:CheY-like chemotaxis protein